MKDVRNTPFHCLFVFYSVKPPCLAIPFLPCSVFPTAAQLHPERATVWLVVAVSQMQTSHFPLTSCQFCWQTFFLSCLSDMTEMNISEKTRGTYFPFLSGLSEWLQEGAEAMGCTWFLPLSWGLNQECMKANKENSFYFVSLTSYHHISYGSHCTLSG